MMILQRRFFWGPATLFALLLLLAPSLARALPAAGLRGMVASAHPEASQAGVEMLRAGGNAVDAAVATAFVLAVVEPYSSGIGGGGFALVRVGESLVFLDFREVAPQKASRDMYMKDGKPQQALSRDGALAVAVPGAVAGYLELHRRFGKLPRAKVLAPAIRVAAKGFLVDERYRSYVSDRLDVLRADPEASRVFLVPGKGGEPPSAPPLGHLLVQKDLARTLRAIAKDGAAAFYTGSVAKKLVADMKGRGGLLTLADLAAFKVRERKPLVGTFRGMAVASSPPPSAGGQVVLTLLNQLEMLPAGTAWHDPAALHLYIEASKYAYADRYLLGDPDFVADPTAALISKERAARLHKLITKRAKRATEVQPGEGAQLATTASAPSDALRPTGNDTTHLCTVDAQGNAVSLTTTVNYGWGAGIVARGTGIVWNDEMDDFAIAPGVPNVYGVVGSEANAVAPGKVPLSSMSPTIVFAGPNVSDPVRLVVGSPGGPRIPSTVVQVIWRHLVAGANIEKAINMGRVHHQHLPDVAMFEAFALDPETVHVLEKAGHKLEAQSETWSNAMAISIDPKTGVRTGAADGRGVGVAIAE